MLSRRKFVQSFLALPSLYKTYPFTKARVITVTGEIDAADLGKTLVHEHVLVDFIGANKITPDRWNDDEVAEKALPYLLEIKAKGITSIAECTPAYLGRDVKLLQALSQKSGLHILTNTGYYGASDNKYLPAIAHSDSARELANQWIKEFTNGIDGTNIKPGFIKIGVNPGNLSGLHQKLVEAAALTHLETGLTICSHTGAAAPAYEQLEILKRNGVHPNAFVWVHAHATDHDFIMLGKTGCWISLDGINSENLEQHVNILNLLKFNKLLKQVVVSQDAGWYKPGEPGGGDFRSYTTISDRLIPLLRSRGFTKADIHQILVVNPAHMLTIKVRRL